MRLQLARSYDFFVPETYKFEITGDFAPGVSAKDSILTILGTVKEGGCSKKVAEYSGDTIRRMGMDGRFTMCNMSVEMSARTGIVNPDEVTAEFMRDTIARHPELAGELSSKIQDGSSKVTSDREASYASVMESKRARLSLKLHYLTRQQTQNLRANSLTKLMSSSSALALTRGTPIFLKPRK